MPTAMSASAISTMIQMGNPVKGSVPPPIAPVELSTPDADSTRPSCELTTGLAMPGLLGSAGLGAAAGGLLLPLGPCPGSPGLPGSGVGFGRCVGGGGGCVPQALPRFPLSACTSTSWPPEQGEAL